MAFTNQFKSLSNVLKHFQIHYIEADFKIVRIVEINEAVRQDIVFTLKEVAYDVSEAAICENLIYPILKDAWKNYSDIFSIWSHQALEYDDDLTGIPDYLISKRSELGKIIFDFPLLAVVEAKKDNFSLGWAQCSLEMVAIQKINNNANLAVYGLVSNGEIWEIAKLENHNFTFYNKRFVIEELDVLFNVLVSVLELCKLQLNRFNLLNTHE
ncbi:hypothetical protein [Crenothrix sp.]|uniref:hypothetical protein n=1 Tax=Crenothrix sp. TaxID=3100433 RepID=UPI00374D418B